METIEKIDIAKMKSDIKAMVEKQKFYKNQRRTEKLVGKRKMPAWEATQKHQYNREELRAMYAAYGQARGKSFSQIENHYPEEGHPLKDHPFPRKIERIIKTYTINVKVETQEIE
jgi:hypothetical protein